MPEFSPKLALLTCLVCFQPAGGIILNSVEARADHLAWRHALSDRVDSRVLEAKAELRRVAVTADRPSTNLGLKAAQKSDNVGFKFTMCIDALMPVFLSLMSLSLDLTEACSSSHGSPDDCTMLSAKIASECISVVQIAYQASPVCFPKDDEFQQYLHNRDQNCKSRIAMGMAAIPGIVASGYEIKQACAAGDILKNESFLVKSCGLKIGEAVGGFKGAMGATADAASICFQGNAVERVTAVFQGEILEREGEDTGSALKLPKIAQDEEARRRCSAKLIGTLAPVLSWASIILKMYSECSSSDYHQKSKICSAAYSDMAAHVALLSQSGFAIRAWCSESKDEETWGARDDDQDLEEVEGLIRANA